MMYFVLCTQGMHIYNIYYLISCQEFFFYLVGKKWAVTPCSGTYNT